MTEETTRAELVRQSVDLMIHTARMHHRGIDRMFGDTGLHRGQRKVLMYLSRSGEIPSQRELASHFDISPACVARTLKSLSSEGYIVRTGDADDLRRNQVRITEKGLRVVRETTQTFDRFDQSMFEGVSEEEMRAFIRLAEKLQSNLQTCKSEEEKKRSQSQQPKGCVPI